VPRSARDAPKKHVSFKCADGIDKDSKDEYGGVRKPSTAINRSYVKPVKWNTRQINRLDNLILLPCWDEPILLTLRKNPDKERKRKEKQLDEKLSDMIDHLTNMQFPPHIWFIMDSLLKALDDSVCSEATTYFTELKYPQSLSWIPQSLYGLAEKPGLNLRYVFLCVGFDQHYWHSGPLADVETDYVEGVEGIIKWFKQQVVGQIIRRSFAEKEVEAVSPYVRAQLPRFVLITIPEIGTWTDRWRKHNQFIRQFVADYNRKHPAVPDTLEVLDWAALCTQEYTLEKRIQLLLEEANHRYALIIERNNVDDPDDLAEEMGQMELEEDWESQQMDYEELDEYMEEE
jgi:hypothetical protein